MKCMTALLLAVAAMGLLAFGGCRPSSPIAPAQVPPVARQPAKELTLDLGNKVSMKLVLIPAGRFMMGSPVDEKERRNDEGPQHQVTIAKPFYMAIYTVTQEQYEQVMGKNPSHSAKLRKPQNPVEMVSWHDAMEFCKTLSTKTGQTVRLPTEAQWEYACRAETTTRFFYGDDPWQMDDYAWYERNGSQQTHPVGEKKPNAWGVYDMEGNVWQWCFDWYADSYAHAKNEDPQGPDSGSKRVVRGAYYSVQTHWLRCASRGYSKPDDRLFTFIGFRVVVDVK